MRILVTGAAGFVGSHLLEFLIQRGHQDETWGGDGLELWAADRWYARRSNIAHLEGMIAFREFDMTDGMSARLLIREARPDRIFHLAAQSFVPTSWKAPEDTIRTNVIGELNLLEAVRDEGLNPRIQIACSSEEYGLVSPDELPITEKNELRPLSPYAVSKVAQDLLGYQYFKSYGMRIVRTRAFNHTGPRRGEQFATSAFAKRIVEIEAGLSPAVIKVGNLEAERDFTDVRDMVRGYWLALDKGEPGEVYNLCSGNAVPMLMVLEILLSLSTRGSEITVTQDPALMRPSDVPVLKGSFEKFAKATGWQPKIPLKKTLKDLLEYWRYVTIQPRD